jgi:hypothetical protein
MSLLFRKTKYSFNSHKSLNPFKNTTRLARPTRFPYNWLIVVIGLGFLINHQNVKYLMKRIVDDNRLIQANFENRKTKQMAFDFMVYTGSTNEQTDADKFSLF